MVAFFTQVTRVGHRSSPAARTPRADRAAETERECPMLTRLAIFLHAHGRRVLLVALIGAPIAGAFGFGVAKHMSPYSANDPATQSVQATKRFEAASGRKIDPGIVAIVGA